MSWSIEPKQFNTTIFGVVKLGLFTARCLTLSLGNSRIKVSCAHSSCRMEYCMDCFPTLISNVFSLSLSLEDGLIQTYLNPKHQTHVWFWYTSIFYTSLTITFCSAYLGESHCSWYLALTYFWSKAFQDHHFLLNYIYLFTDF